MNQCVDACICLFLWLTEPGIKQIPPSTWTPIGAGPRYLVYPPMERTSLQILPLGHKPFLLHHILEVAKESEEGQGFLEHLCMTWVRDEGALSFIN